MVAPDLAIICNPSKLDEKGCLGAPDLIMEIISPTSVKTDRVLKFNIYESAGVKEYWIVEPEGKVINVFKLGENKRYGRPENYSEEDLINVGMFEGLTIDLRTIFNF